MNGRFSAESRWEPVQQTQIISFSRFHSRTSNIYRWGLYNDSAVPSRFVEIFVVESWAEHLRQHERVTVADREIEDVVRAFHIGQAPPIITHFLYARGAAPRR